MPLPGFLSLPRKDRRTRSKDKREADANQDPGEAGLPPPPPMEADQDRGAGSRPLPTAAPLILQDRVSSGTLAILFRVIYLTALPCNAGKVVSDPTKSVTKKAKRPKPWDRILNRSTSTSEDKPESSLASTVYASTKVVVDVVKESSDVFPPLKALAGGLMAILKHHDVRPIPSSLFTKLTITPASDG